MALKWPYGKIAIQGYPGQFLGIGNHDHAISQLSEHYNEPRSTGWIVVSKDTQNNRFSSSKCQLLSLCYL